MTATRPPCDTRAQGRSSDRCRCDPVKGRADRVPRACNGIAPGRPPCLGDVLTTPHTARDDRWRRTATPPVPLLVGRKTAGAEHTLAIMPTSAGRRLMSAAYRIGLVTHVNAVVHRGLLDGDPGCRRRPAGSRSSPAGAPGSFGFASPKSACTYGFTGNRQGGAVAHLTERYGHTRGERGIRSGRPAPHGSPPGVAADPSPTGSGNGVASPGGMMNRTKLFIHVV